MTLVEMEQVKYQNNETADVFKTVVNLNSLKLIIFTLQ